MGARLLMPFRAGVRPVLLAAFAALAWLIWGAATAQAAVPSPDADALLQPASTLVKTIPPSAQPVTSAAGNVAAATATTVLAPDTGLADVLTAAATPVVTGASDTVTSLSAALPALPLVQAPLQLSLPDVLPLPGLVPLPTPAPGTVPIAAPSGPASGAPLALAADAAGDPEAGAAASVGRFGFAPALDLPGPGARSAAAPGPSGPSGPPAAPDPLPFSALPGQSSAGGSASSGGFGGAADIAGSWPALPATTGAINRPVPEAPPASPAFDPGSSPD